MHASINFIPILLPPRYTRDEGHHQMQWDSTILSLDASSYSELVENAPKGHIALVLLVGSEDSRHALQLKQLLVAAVSKHRWGNVRLCSLSIGTYPAWFREFASTCLHLDSGQIDGLMRNYQEGKAPAIVLSCFGAKKQFCVYPDDVMVLVGQGISASPSPSGQSVCDVLEGAFGLGDGLETNGTSVSPTEASLLGGAGGRWQQEAKALLGWMERLADGTLKRNSVESWPLLR